MKALLIAALFCAGCATTQVETPTGVQTCYTQKCVRNAEAYATRLKSEAERARKAAQRKADSEREAAERKAYRDAHPELEMQNKINMLRYLDSQTVNAYGCLGNMVPVPSFGSYGCGYRSW